MISEYQTTGPQCSHQGPHEALQRFPAWYPHHRLSWLNSSCGEEELEIGVPGVEFFRVQFLGGNAVQKGNTANHVSVSMHLALSIGEELGKETPDRRIGESPEIPGSPHIRLADLGNAGASHEKYAVRLQQVIQGCHCGPYLKNKL
jgi:hypothetical protein